MNQPIHYLVERQLKKALAEDRAEGSERAPCRADLPNQSEKILADMAMRVANRMIADAGALPAAFKMRKLLEAAEARLALARDEQEREIAKAVVSDLKARQGALPDAEPARYPKPQTPT